MSEDKPPPPPLRSSLFPSVPPFINYVPTLRFEGLSSSSQLLEYGPQYWDQWRWDQDHFWRIPSAMGKVVKELDDLLKTLEESGRDKRKRPLSICKTAKNIFNFESPFAEKSVDSLEFLDSHPGVKLKPFPNLEHLSNKAELGRLFIKARLLFDPEEFDFHPLTLSNFPKDLLFLEGQMKIQSDQFWIYKPAKRNNGSGVRLVQDLAEVRHSDYLEPFVIQKYIKSPLLIDGYKFDIRIYVLLTSMDPLCVYMYTDGLVRIATELYSEDPGSINESRMHITNFAINKDSKKYVFEEDGLSRKGNKWRLVALWGYLNETFGFDGNQFERLWKNIEDLVIKTLAIGYNEFLADFKRKIKTSSYNSYKILGLDVLIDRDFKPHLIEVNSRPALLDDEIDKQVNRPMMDEIIRIVGFHVPQVDVSPFRLDLLRQSLQNENFSSYNPSLYLRNDFDAREKKDRFETLRREEYLDNILEDLTSGDLRVLIKMEEEFSQTSRFGRIFPTSRTFEYFKYFQCEIPYFDKLADAYEHKYGSDREAGIQALRELCKKNVHL